MREIEDAGPWSDLALNERDCLTDLLVLARRERQLPLRRNAAGRWEVGLGCRCPISTFGSAVEAGGHARTIEHLASQFAASPDLVTHGLADLAPGVATESVLEPALPVAGWGSLELVGEVRGLDQAWSAGLHWEWVERTHHELEAGPKPLPLGLYLAAAFSPAPLAWLRLILASRGPTEAERAAWSYTSFDAGHPDSRRCLLAAGVDEDICARLAAQGAGYEEVSAVVTAARGDFGRWARTLAGWLEAGCRPGPGDFAVLARHRLADFVPSGADLGYFTDEVLVELPIVPTTTQLALLLALCNGPEEVMNILRGGLSQLDAIAALSHEANTPDGVASRS